MLALLSLPLAGCDGHGLPSFLAALGGARPAAAVAEAPAPDLAVQPVAFRPTVPDTDAMMLDALERRAASLPYRTNWSCVPYARAVSGLQIRGDAWRWWAAAAGHYQRGHQPRVGAVLVLSRTNRLRRGHVAVVKQIVSPREIIVTHANWIRRGHVVGSMRVIDVSAHNDWSRTRWWYAPAQSFGSVYPASGFIYPDATMVAAAPVDGWADDAEVAELPDAAADGLALDAPSEPIDPALPQLRVQYLSQLAAVPVDPPELNLEFATQLAALAGG